MDRDDLRRALVDLRVAFDDADAVTQDQMRPLRKREFGPVLAAHNYGDARSRVLAAHAYLMRLVSVGEPGDPSGNGGAGPVH
jgi:hypothetical protein